MSQQASRSALLVSVVTAVVSSATAVVINIATGGSGGFAVWALAIALTVLMGVLPHVRPSVRRSRRGSHKKWSLAIACLAVLALFVSDAPLMSEMTVDPERDESPSLVAGGSTSNDRDFPVPITGVEEPRPTNPDSIRAADRITVALNDPKYVPSDVVVRDSTVGGSTIRVFAREGAFTAYAELSRGQRIIYLEVSAIWYGQKSFTVSCVHCYEEAATDGTRLVYSKVETREEVSIVKRGGPIVRVTQTVPSPEEFGEVLTWEQLAAMATGIAGSMQRPEHG